MELTIGIWPLLFLIAAVQGVFLGVLIYLKKSTPNRYLAGLILSFSIMLLFYVCYWTGLHKQIHPIFGALQGMTYLLGPLTLGFLITSKKGTPFNQWHILPFIVYVLFYTLLFFIPALYSPTLVLAQTIVQNLHLIVYSFLIFSYIRDHYAKDVRNKWYTKIAMAYSGYVLSFLSYFVLVWTGTLQVEYDYMISMASSVFVYFIGYHAFLSPDLFKHNELAKYENSSLSDSAAQAILGSIRKHMDEEKPYLNSSLKLQQLADDLSISAHHLSQCINDLEGQNFSDFINQYRIKTAMEMLKDPGQVDLKIIHVALDSGFNNKTSFNNAFKKFAGITPSQFRKQQLSIYEAIN